MASTHDDWVRTHLKLDLHAARRSGLPGARTIVQENEDGTIDLLSGSTGGRDDAPHHRDASTHQAVHHKAPVKHAEEPAKHAAPQVAAPPVSTAVPRAKQPDCKIVRGKVPGPKHHVLCATHQHVIDEQSGQIIANSLADYKASHPAEHQAAEASHRAPASPSSQHRSGKPAPTRHADTAEKATTALDDTSDGEVTSSKHTDFNTKVVNTARFVSNRARINATQFTTMLQLACDDFKQFAEGKIREVQGDLLVGDVMQVLVGAVLGEVTGKITAKVTEDIGKAVLKVITGQVNKALTDATKAADPNSSNPADLSRAVGALAQKTRDAAMPIVEAVAAAIDGPVDQIVTAASRNAALSSADEAFLMQFYEMGPAETDTILEGFGIPSPANAKAIRLSIYKGLVAKFEEKRIWAKASFGEKMKMGFARDFGDEKNTLAHRANEAAEQETQRRGAEMSM